MPECAGPLLALLSEEDLEIMRELDARLGGGTLLAALWNEHRESRDLDIFIRAEQFDDNFDKINSMQKRIHERANPGTTGEPWTNPKAGTLVIKINTPSGSIELIRDTTKREERQEPQMVKGTGGRLGTHEPEEVLYRKIENRAQALAERDMYDMAWAHIHEPQTLNRALKKCTKGKVRTLREDLSLVEQIKRYPHKPVENPKWRQWRKEAPRVLREALDGFLGRIRGKERENGTREGL